MFREDYATCFYIGDDASREFATKARVEYDAEGLPEVFEKISWDEWEKLPEMTKKS